MARDKDLTVSTEERGWRLDRFLRSRIPALSRGAARRLLQRRMVQLEGGDSKKGTILRAGQRVSVAAAAWEAAPRPQPELELLLIAQLPDLVVINKPAGMPGHPLVPGETGTVANALVARFPECARSSPQAREGGLVHRLDMGTSGVLLAARTRQAHGRLRQLFSAGRVAKEYLALVEGRISGEGRVTSVLRPFPGDPSRVQVVSQYAADGPVADTRFEPRQQLGRFTLVQVRCATGQRHQVRAHLAHAGHPVAGDVLYGAAPMPEAGGALLHASRVRLPDGGGDFEAGLPPKRQQIVHRLAGKMDR